MGLEPMAMKLNDNENDRFIEVNYFSTGQDIFHFTNFFLISLGAVLMRPMYLLSHSD